MKRAAFDQFCGALPAATNVIQWGGASVWKVGGRIFAVCSSWGAEDAKTGPRDRIAFKCSDLAYELLTQQPGIRPAPYLARAKWVQLEGPRAMATADLKRYLAEAHRLVAAKLTRKARAALGLEALSAPRRSASSDSPG